MPSVEITNVLSSQIFDVENVDMSRVFSAFKALADRKKRIYDADLEALVTGSYYAVVRIAEQYAPALGILLGASKQPRY